MELRGEAKQASEFDLKMDNCCFLLMFQFVGKLFLGGSMPLEIEQYGGYSSGAHPLRCRLAPGKTWSVIFGLPNRRIREVQEEWPLLDIQPPCENRAISIEKMIIQDVGYRHRKIFDQIQLIRQAVYSTAVKLEYYFTQLLELYHTDLGDAVKSHDLDGVALYRRAIEYIRRHYMDPNIDRNTIADNLAVSVRTLNRAFEGKPNNVTNYVRLIRLHKARELLRTTDCALDEIACRLNYTDVKHMTKSYIKEFGYSPAIERKKRHHPVKCVNVF